MQMSWYGELDEKKKKKKKTESKSRCFSGRSGQMDTFMPQERCARTNNVFIEKKGTDERKTNGSEYS